MLQVHADSAGSDKPREYLVTEMPSVDAAEMLALEIMDVISTALVTQRTGVVLCNADGGYELISFRAARKLGKIER